MPRNLKIASPRNMKPTAMIVAASTASKVTRRRCSASRRSVTERKTGTSPGASIVTNSGMKTFRKACRSSMRGLSEFPEHADQLLVQLGHGLRDDADLADDVHEVDVAAPAGHDVVVKMARQASPGAAAEVG